MENVLEGLKPEKVFCYFEEISKIPRGSKNEKQISDYLYNLAKEKGWEVVQDNALNIIIKKPASKGYENAPTVILQGHMDMVCDKNRRIDHDFEKDPIKLRIVDDYIYATDTTLGADNGIAVAYCLALLDSDDIPHPPLEVLITTDEETGMTGVIELDGSQFDGTILINMDSEDEGTFIAGCAGGAIVLIKIPVKRVESKYKSAYKISIKGLQGGHSGADIHLERGNANKLIGRVLYDLNEEAKIQIAEINGGSKDNAIPRESEAVILTNESKKVEELIKKWDNILKNEYKFSDPGVRVSVEKSEYVSKALAQETVTKMLAAINLTPNGTRVKSTEIDLVIHSNNLGVIVTEEEYIKLMNSPRSSVESQMDDFISIMKQLAKNLDIEYKDEAFYPGWEYAKESPIRDLCAKTYEELTGKKAKVEAIHAGLECGFLIRKIGKLDTISFGPDMYDVHTPNEHLSISSTERTFNLLCEILRKIK